jgi:glycosyltransferase involved in cell wall biosynthesis
MTTSEKLRVLVAAPLPPPDHGGICNWSRIIRHALADSPRWSLHFVDTSVRYRKVTNQMFISRLTGGSIHGCQTLLALYRSIKRLRPQVIHITTSGGLSTSRNIFELRIAKHFGVPSLIHYRMGRLPHIFAKRGVEWRWTLRAMQLADVVVTLDRRSEACVRECLPNKRVITLPNMVEVDDLDVVRANTDVLARKSESFHIAYFGQILPTKGIAELVEAAAPLAGRDLKFELVGPVGKAFHKKLLRLAASAGSTDWLHFHGSKPHDEVIRIMAGADLIVLPSYSEGFPNVVLEAMALGRPILATGVGAIPEMLDIGGVEECGVIVPPREVQPLTAALERLMADPSLRLEFGKKARQRVGRLYSVPVACCQLTDLWESLVQSNKSE